MNVHFSDKQMIDANDIKSIVASFLFKSVINFGATSLTSYTYAKLHFCIKMCQNGSCYNAIKYKSTTFDCKSCGPVARKVDHVVFLLCNGYQST